ncbi:MAG TPA: hypothetical protein VGF21_10880 [Thermoleophilaceae bacterium]
MGSPVLARTLAIIAALAMTLALVAGYVRHAAVDSDQFANRATVALRDDSVRALLAEKLTDEVVLKHQSDLIAARPIIESLCSSIIGSPAFTELFRAGVRDVHRALFNRDQNTVTFTVADVGTVLAAALQKLQPSIADEVDATGRVEVLQRDLGSAGGTLARIADDVRLIAWLLAAVALVLAVAALVVSPDRRLTVVDLGAAAAGGGVLLVLVYVILRSLAIDHVETPEGRAAAGAVWDAFLGDLKTAAWIMAGSGAVIAAAAASLLRPLDIREPLRAAAARIARRPSRPAFRVLRGLAFVAAGVIVLVERDAVIQLAVTLVGVFLVYEGVTALLQLVYKPSAEKEAVAEARRDLRRLAIPVVAAAIIAGTVAVFVGTGGTTTAAPAEGGCNGHEELCDKPLNEVVLPATHNSMSAPLPGWFSSEQDRPIPGQLADGIRGLLIDTHYADRLPNGRLRTYFGSKKELQRQGEQDGVSPEAVDAALRIRDRAGFSGKGERGMYLCHTFCELGGTRLEKVLDDIHDFLVTHPRVVLVVINQDYVSPADFVGAVRKAGLEQFAYRGPTSGKWSTLGDMIDSGHRVVFLAENRAGAAPWYRPVYKSSVQETPYDFTRTDQLTKRSLLAKSCEPNRGPKSAPLFLLNHWVTLGPLIRPSDAEKVNARRPLLARIRECRRLRHHLPNLVAVNFYKRGDLFKVVDELNGVR